MPLAESPFSCCLLDALFYLSCVLLFPSYWFIDRLLSCVVPTSVERSGVARRVLCLIFGVPLFLLLFVLSIPLCFLGLLLWSPLHQIRRPFSYQRSAASTDPAERTITGGCSFIFVSANLCLLPDGLARFSNLSHTQRRVAIISKLLCAPPERVQENGEDSLPVCTEDVLPMIERPQKVTGGADSLFEVSVGFPQDPDFICLQEVFDGRASRKLRRCLGSSYPHILYDVGPTGPHCCGFKFFNSGLFLASRHPLLNAKYYIYPNGRGEDALASKGLLCVKVHLGSTEQKQSIVGYINCTHLHAPESDAAIRCDQMSLILQWVSDFQTENSQDGELVAFDVLCGDLNFDNCSTDDCLEQKHKLFSTYSDPCRDCAGRDRPGTMGTLLRQELLYHEAVNTPARLKSTLLSDSERRVYVASPLPQGESGEHWTGRRIDYIMYREADSLLPVVVDKFQFITCLAGLSDHIPVSLHLSSSLSESTAL